MAGTQARFVPGLTPLRLESDSPKHLLQCRPHISERQTRSYHRSRQKTTRIISRNARSLPSRTLGDQLGTSAHLEIFVRRMQPAQRIPRTNMVLGISGRTNKNQHWAFSCGMAISSHNQPVHDNTDPRPIRCSHVRLPQTHSPTMSYFHTREGSLRPG